MKTNVEEPLNAAVEENGARCQQDINVRYTMESFTEATRDLFKLLNSLYPESHSETMTCVDFGGSFPVAHWRPAKKSPVCLTIELQDDGGKPYAVVEASNNQGVQGVLEHKKIYACSVFANIYPAEFVHLPVIISHLLSLPAPFIKLV